MLALALAALTLAPPVSGVIERPFAYEGDPFARGHHRGVDLAAAPGTPVRAACSGRVTFAGRAGVGAVAMRCGRFSVTHLPLHPAVRAGDRVSAGAPLGTVARSREHEGLHLGVRTASDRLGYVDPAPLLRDRRPPALPVAPRAIARRP
ncbi:MAG TPA: M23 family metallopeptidase, partial [Solirubrobacteraceae bacterium]|nr:M23 family metallopeptidase [Solirubrobacteraceae bacterium]